MVYLMRAKFQHGLKSAWYRDIIRPRILKTAPVTSLADSSCEIHVLTSKDDWLNLIWVLKSLFQFEECRFNLCIHEDGTVPPEGIEHLRRLFPTARFVDRRMADARLEKLLKDYPLAYQFRFSNPFSMKVFDFAEFLENDRMFLIDSDILFFKRPEVILGRIKNASYKSNSLNRDWDYGYSVPMELIERSCDFGVASHINSGLGLIHRESLNFDWIEQFLQIPGILEYRHRIEQTLIALCSCKYGYEMLPAEYDVSLRKTRFDFPVKHYTSPIRQSMYREGMAALQKKLLSSACVSKDES